MRYIYVLFLDYLFFPVTQTANERSKYWDTRRTKIQLNVWKLYTIIKKLDMKRWKSRTNTSTPLHHTPRSRTPHKAAHTTYQTNHTEASTPHSNTTPHRREVEYLVEWKVECDPNTPHAYGRSVTRVRFYSHARWVSNDLTIVIYIKGGWPGIENKRKNKCPLMSMATPPSLPPFPSPSLPFPPLSLPHPPLKKKESS